MRCKAFHRLACCHGMSVEKSIGRLYDAVFIKSRSTPLFVHVCFHHLLSVFIVFLFFTLVVRNGRRMCHSQASSESRGAWCMALVTLTGNRSSFWKSSSYLSCMNESRHVGWNARMSVYITCPMSSSSDMLVYLFQLIDSTLSVEQNGNGSKSTMKKNKRANRADPFRLTSVCPLLKCVVWWTPMSFACECGWASTAGRASFSL